MTGGRRRKTGGRHSVFSRTDVLPPTTDRHSFTNDRQTFVRAPTIVYIYVKNTTKCPEEQNHITVAFLLDWNQTKEETHQSRYLMRDGNDTDDWTAAVRFDYG